MLCLLLQLLQYIQYSDLRETVGILKGVINTVSAKNGSLRKLALDGRILAVFLHCCRNEFGVLAVVVLTH
jgi:hypothetical protein